MTQNEATILKNAILDATEAYVETKLNMSNFVKTQIGVVYSYQKRNDKYYHTVKCDNGRVTYNNVLSIGNIPFSANSTVFLISPNAQFSNQFILGKLGDTPSNISGGSINIGNGAFQVDSNGDMTATSGSLNGIFKGYIESNSGVINGITYTNNKFFGSPIISNLTESNIIKIDTDSAKPTIIRTYIENNTTYQDEVLWESDLSDKQNFISQSSTTPTTGGENGDLKFMGTDGDGDKELWRNDNGTWVKINFGNSGGGGFIGDAGACRTLLYQGGTTFESNIQLSDDMRNYQYLEIYTLQNNNTWKAQMSYIVNVDYFIHNFPYVSSPDMSTPHYLISMYQNLYTRLICGSDYTKIFAWSGTTETIEAIYGVSFGHMYNEQESIYGSFNGNTLYERTLLFYDQGQPASGWTNISGYEWKYNGITSSDIDALWSADVINCDQNGNYSTAPTILAEWNEANGDFNLNFVTSYYTWLHIIYMK